VADQGCSIHPLPINGMRGSWADKSMGAAGSGIDGRAREILSAFPAGYRGARVPAAVLAIADRAQ
jgi:hypothetical protein